MKVEKFAATIYEQLEEELAEINTNEIHTLESLRNSYSTTLHYITRLKVYVNNYEFADKVDEINFFKNIKPRFLSKLIYYHKRLEIESRLPLGSISDQKEFYLKEVDKANEYVKVNKDFFIYYRTQSNSLDEVYFVRKELDSWLLLNFEDYETDLNFTTIYDYKLSKFIALELLTNSIEKSINKLEVTNHLNKNLNAPPQNKVTWTGSKVSLIELLYALQSTGSCNNGTIDIKQLASHLQMLFNVDLGNYYRVFQEIRIRKASRTAFLDQLKEKLVNRMDESDENPKGY